MAIGPGVISFTKPDTSITFSSSDLTLNGMLAYDSITRSLALLTDEGLEYLSTNLESYGRTPRHGAVFIKDWSEHSGLARDLENAGVGRIINTLTVGPLHSTAFELEVIL